MVRRFQFLLLAGALLLFACVPRFPIDRPAAPAANEPSPASAATAPTASREPAAPSPRAMALSTPLGAPAEHDGQRALEHVRMLAGQIGPRVAGTTGEAAALRYIQAQLTSWGYYVETLAFSFDDPFQQGVVRVDGQEIAARPMAGSAAGRAAGRAVDVGLARPEDIQGRDLQGAVAIAQRGEIPFGEKLANVQAVGAAALVVINSEPGPLLGNLGRTADRPVLGVAGRDGTALQAAAQASATVSVEVPDRTAAQSNNVLARAAPGARCEIVVGAHHDTVPGAPGANDNASGTANVLELARAFAADGLDDGLCFATFGAEESGLHGSQALADRLQAAGELPRAMINLDVTGGSGPIELIGSDALVRLAAELAAQQGSPARPARQPSYSGSDHQSFARLGVPVLYLTSGDFAAIHTPEDTVDRIDAAELDRIGDLAHAAIAALLRNGPSAGA